MENSDDKSIINHPAYIINLIDLPQTNYKKFESFEVDNQQKRTKRMVRFDNFPDTNPNVQVTKVGDLIKERHQSPVVYGNWNNCTKIACWIMVICWVLIVFLFMHSF